MDPRFVPVQSGNCTLRVAVQGEGPLVLMVHGWPEGWYSWRKQMAPLARAGFTAAAMDMRGYGGSTAPEAVEAYDIASMVGDLQAVADQLGGGRAILAGHDWGATIVWNAALADPQRFPAVAGLAIPHVGHGREPFIDIARKVFTGRDRFFYQVYFQDEGVAEAELEANPRNALKKLYYALSGDAPRNAWPIDKRHGDSLLHRLPEPDALPAWLSQKDLDVMAAEFRRSGFRGSINRFRNFHRDYAWQAQFASRRIEQPALFIAGDRDPSLRMFRGHLEKRMREQVPGLRGYHILEACGHWTQQERPNRINRLLLDWLKAERLGARNTLRRAA